MPLDKAIMDRIGARLLREPESVIDAELVPDWLPEDPFDSPPVPAAVLIGLVRREDGPPAVVYTERAPSLRSHSGQISFPGGRMEPGDASPADTALREAGEEIGIIREEAEVIGYMPHYYTGTNYIITPVVAEVRPSRPFIPNPAEVTSVFEVPLSWLAEESSYTTFRVRRGETEHTTWQLDHGGFRIWGITANLTRRFRDLALVEEGT